MPTTKSNFLLTSGGGLAGSTVKTTSQIEVLDPTSVVQESGAGQTLKGGTVLDKTSTDLSAAGFAKNGAFTLSLTASTPVTTDLTNISGTATLSAGDNSYATVNQLIFVNPGAQDVTVGAAASAPFLGPLGGTTPTFKVPAGGTEVWNSPAGWTTSSANNLKFDPGSANATLYVSVGGA